MTDAWLRFQKIMHYGDFILPVDNSFRLTIVSDREIILQCDVKREVGDVFDYAEKQTGSDWIINTGYPVQEKAGWSWKLSR